MGERRVWRAPKETKNWTVDNAGMWNALLTTTLLRYSLVISAKLYFNFFISYLIFYVLLFEPALTDLAMRANQRHFKLICWTC